MNLWSINFARFLWENLDNTYSYVLSILVANVDWTGLRICFLMNIEAGYINCMCGNTWLEIITDTHHEIKPCVVMDLPINETITGPTKF